MKPQTTHRQKSAELFELYSERFLTMTELRMKLCGRSRSAIYIDIDAGRLPRPMKLGGTLFWSEAEIDAALRGLRDQGDSR